MKLYHEFVRARKKLVHVGFGIVHGFRHPLGGLEQIDHTFQFIQHSANLEFTMSFASNNVIVVLIIASI